MLQPKVVADLRLREHGYAPIPLDPAYATFSGGVPVFFHDDAARAQESIARRSRRAAAAYPGFMELLERAAAFVRPLLLRPPPALGSRRPADVPGLVAWAARTAGLPGERVRELFRLMTMSVGDLLDEWFEDDELKGCLASTGVVGVWAGPRTPGTAYNLLHHELGSLDGRPGSWGHVRGGMGAISLALAAAARAHGATVRTGAPVVSIDVDAGGAVTGVTLEDGAQLRAPVVVSGAHPQTTILDLAGAEHFPGEVVADMRRYRTRGASVKVNLVLDRFPVYAGATAAEQHALLRTGLAMCPSIDALERAWQDAVLGRPAAAPYVELEVPSAVDPTLADGDGCVATMFTQYGPPDAGGWPDGARERYLAACLDLVETVAPGVRDSVVHAEVLAPPDLERIFGLRGGSIFHGEQDLAQLAFMRPSPALARYATPVRGLYLCGAGTHPGGGSWPRPGTTRRCASCATAGGPGSRGGCACARRRSTPSRAHRHCVDSPWPRRARVRSPGHAPT